MFSFHRDAGSGNDADGLVRRIYPVALERWPGLSDAAKLAALILYSERGPGLVEVNHAEFCRTLGKSSESSSRRAFAALERAGLIERVESTPGAGGGVVVRLLDPRDVADRRGLRAVGSPDPQRLLDFHEPPPEPPPEPTPEPTPEPPPEPSTEPPPEPTTQTADSPRSPEIPRLRRVAPIAPDRRPPAISPPIGTNNQEPTISKTTKPKPPKPPNPNTRRNEPASPRASPGRPEIGDQAAEVRPTRPPDELGDLAIGGPLAAVLERLADPVTAEADRETWIRDRAARIAAIVRRAERNVGTPAGERLQDWTARTLARHWYEIDDVDQAIRELLDDVERKATERSFSRSPAAYLTARAKRLVERAGGRWRTPHDPTIGSSGDHVLE